MKIYAIYVNPNNLYAPVVPVSEGFSFIATFFSLLWALYHKMWFPLATVLIITSLATLLHNMAPSFLILPIIHFTIMISFALFSSDLREFDLRTKGYELEDIIFALSEEEAEIKFYERTAKLSLL